MAVDSTLESGLIWPACLERGALNFSSCDDDGRGEGKFRLRNIIIYVSLFFNSGMDHLASLRDTSGTHILSIWVIYVVKQRENV